MPRLSVLFALAAALAAADFPQAEISNGSVRARLYLPGQSVSTALEGFGATPKDYDIRVENAAARAGVRQTSDRPLAKLVFWSIRTTVCPEAYIDIRIEPGKEFTWRIAYDFYTLPESGAK